MEKLEKDIKRLNRLELRLENEYAKYCDFMRKLTPREYRLVVSHLYLYQRYEQLKRRRIELENRVKEAEKNGDANN